MKKLISLMMVVLIAVSGLAVYTSAQETEIAINEENFPDENFRSYIMAVIDKNGDDVLSSQETAETKGLDITARKVKDLTGVEYFTELTQLFCGNNSIESIDLSSNTKIESLDVSYNNLTSLDVSMCGNLKHLTCSNNKITSIDLSGNKELESLYCSGNQLTSIDLSGLDKLLPMSIVTAFNSYTLDLGTDSSFDLSELPGNFDVSRATGWEGADVDGTVLMVDYGVNSVTYTYDFGNGCRDRFELIINKTEEPVEINQENFIDSTFRNFVKNMFDTNGNGILEVNEIADVKTIDISELFIMELNGIEHFKALETVNCSGCNILSLDFSGNPKLREVYCSGNLISDIDVSKNKNLTVLDCSDNRLSSLDLSSNKELQKLDCSNNIIDSIDLTQNTKLTSLDCSDNFLLGIDIGDNTALTSDSVNSEKNTAGLEFAGNKLDLSELDKNFDVSRASGWTGCSAEGNILYLDENAEEITYNYDIGSGIVKTFTIGVTGTDKYYVFLTRENFPDLTFRNYLLNFYDLNMNKILSKSETEKITALYINGTIEDLKGIEYFYALEDLSCSDSELKSLDVSKNAALKSLDCTRNHLTSLDVSGNALLQTVTCNDNEYVIEVGSNNLFDVDELPGNFDISRASGWQGASAEGGMLKVDDEAERITYKYDLGNGQTADFALIVTHKTEYDIGDVNMDSVINIDDATMIQKHLAGYEISPEEFDESLADADDNGVVDVSDATAVQIIIAYGDQ